MCSTNPHRTCLIFIRIVKITFSHCLVATVVGRWKGQFALYFRPSVGAGGALPFSIPPSYLSPSFPSQEQARLGLLESSSASWAFSAGRSGSSGQESLAKHLTQVWTPLSPALGRCCGNGDISLPGLGFLESRLCFLTPRAPSHQGCFIVL